MCQGVFPSAFNPCDCSSSELPPYAQPKSKQIKQCSTHHNLKQLPPSNDASPHPHSSMLQNLSTFSASSLLAKWVATPPPPHHINVTKQEQQHDPHHGTGMPASGGPSSSASVCREPARLDTPHLIHAFFFDST